MTTTPRSLIAERTEYALHLAPHFQPDIDTLLSEGLVCYGIKGSGKTNVVTLVGEQIGRYFVPQIFFDTERELHHLVNHLPQGTLATAQRCPSGYDILHKGLQVVVDLQSWETDEAAALAMCQILDELFTAANAIASQDRWPCAIHLDEAQYWLPQAAVSYLSRETRKLLSDAFHKIATRGRKQGLTPFYYTQRISEIRKEAVAQAGVLILMRQTLDNDLRRYCEYISGTPAKIKKMIRSLPRGRAVVLLPDGTQLATTFNPCASQHVSHTPTVQRAISKFACPSEETPAPRKARKPKEPVLSTEVERIYAALEQDSRLSPMELTARFGCDLEVAKQALVSFFYGACREVQV